jgi:hypothetical protein
MMTSRRQFLFSTMLLAGCSPLPVAQPVSGTDDTGGTEQTAARRAPAPASQLAVYVIPLDDFPEALASRLAGLLQEQLAIPIKASLRLPPLGLVPFPGTNQYPGEDILEKARAASDSLPGTSAGTYHLFLTTRDINSRSARLRFYFSLHSPRVNSSVVSLARILEYARGKPEFTDRSAARLVKMSKRAIGEMKLGWSRSTEPTDLMYAPLMSLDDLDRIGFDHRPRAAGEDSPTPAPKQSPRSI